ncbi:MAG: bifunctional DNA-formamidopyrimidine glycosylase/DNA-(apurinic or apyrimidinic site) lyase [Rickettsiales bacterium]|jgi:formamidopyrimidine-DNA glycosylase|nr:bifunctional DNA-formamidopyrimidine glycosylase/DNA-(apurinic or apyrimidinic site) lyase [Rickettsiales bacterium]
MPELPEVETICQGLRNSVLNQTITEVYHLTKHKLRQEIPADIVQKISNTNIIDIVRRAKYIQIFLSNNQVLLVHLGMSGKVLIKKKDYIYQKHDHFSFILEGGIVVVYNDPRRFGLITLVKRDELENHILIRNLGIEPFDTNFTSGYLEKVLKRKQPIKLSLMDNKHIVGVGNIYASECLFLSKISPFRASNTLTSKEVKLLYSKIIEVLDLSIKKGGSSLKDYASVSGEKGYFQNSFNVYGREGEECRSCNSYIIKLKQGGRASFYCDKCQK